MDESVPNDTESLRVCPLRLCVAQRSAGRVCPELPAAARRQTQGVKQRAPERLTEEEVDERIQHRIKGGKPQRALLQLEEKQLLLAIEHASSCLADGVRHSGEVEGNEANKEDRQH